MKRFLRLTRLFVCLCAVLTSTSVFAVAQWIGTSYINVNGTWYQAHGTEAWASGGAFDGHDFGPITISSLTIGGQLQIGDNGADWGSGAGNWMHYSIDDGTPKDINIAYETYGYGEYSNNMRFQSGGSSFSTTAIEISDLSPGSHTLKVWFGPIDGVYENGQSSATVYTATFTKAIDISGATVTGIESSYDWTGNAIEPAPMVTLGDDVLRSTYDYEVTYSDDCTNVGSHNVTIEGKGDYAGTIVVPFTINNAYFMVGPMTDWQRESGYKLVKNPDDENEYYISGVELLSGDEIKVESAAGDWYPGGNDNNYVISANGIYDVYFRPNYDGGDDWFGGTIYVANVTPATDISGATITGIESSYDWTGSAVHPVPVVTLGGNELSSTDDYYVTYSEGCTNVGTYTVTITGKGNYAGTISRSFKINNVYFLVGTMNSWNYNDSWKFVKNTSIEGEEYYYLNDVQLSASAEFKVRSAEGDWYPGGSTSNYTNTNAGKYDIEFNPNGGISGWYEGYFKAYQSNLVTLAPTGYGTYYNSVYDVTLPAGIVAYILSGVNNNKPTYKMIADGDDATNKTVPAGTAMLLYSADVKTSGVEAPVTLTLTSSSTTGTFTNLLHGSDVATTTTGGGEGAKYYKLTYSDNDDNFGWYWGEDEGAPFTSPAHKAWLALPSTGARAFFDLPGDNFTGISKIENRQQNADNVWYDLNGRRVNAPTTKGIYVKDGRKLVIK